MMILIAKTFAINNAKMEFTLHFSETTKKTCDKYHLVTYYNKMSYDRLTKSEKIELYKTIEDKPIHSGDDD